MEKSIELHNKIVPYTLKLSARAKRLRLAVYPDGSFVVTAPARLPMGTVEKFIVQKSSWVLNRIDYFKSHTVQVIPKPSKLDYAKAKDRALLLAHAKIAKFNKFYSFKFRKVTIRNQQTRWGSCSKKGNLSFNYKIVNLPEHLADYIVVHELCHLGEFNHSPQFWDLVAKGFPDHRQARAQLRKISVGYQ